MDVKRKVSSDLEDSNSQKRRVSLNVVFKKHNLHNKYF